MNEWSNRLANEWCEMPPRTEFLGQVTTLMDRNEELEEANRQLKLEVQRLAALAYLDPLTGLGNRRHFDECVASELRRAARKREALTLLICDVDHFKDCNDSYGHDAGDVLLIEIGRRLRQFCRRGGDLAVRYAGDEFALLWPGVSRAAARGLAEDLRTAVGESPIRHPGGRRRSRVTLSVGVTTFLGARACAPERLVSAADRALYRAKRAGRDRAVFLSCA